MRCATGRGVSRERSNVFMFVYEPTGNAGSTVGAGRGPYSLDELGRVADKDVGTRGRVNPLVVGDEALPAALHSAFFRGNGSQAGESANSSIRKFF